MPNVLRLDTIEATTPLEASLLALLVAERRKNDRLRQLAAKPTPKPEPKPEPPKPAVKLVPPKPSKPYRGPPAREAGIKRIQLAVCKKFGITRSEMLGSYRHRKVAEARHVAVMLCYALTAHSYPFIGRWFNYRDHSTMINSVRVMYHVHDELVKQFTSNDPLFDWVDRAHELVMDGRAKPAEPMVENSTDPVEIVVDIAQERVAFANSIGA